ncbi:MAG: helix-turn-helix domain-containing protein [Patescibacteria group bacterium]
MESSTSLEEHLISFGLSKQEANLYLALSGKPALTALELSRLLRVPRTSVYDNLTNLIEQGLIERIIKYKSQQFRAYPIETLQSIVDTQQSNLTVLSNSLAYLKTHIHEASLATSTATQVRYYHGTTGIRQMMWNALSAEKENIGYSIMGRKEIVGSAFLKRFLEEFSRKKLIDRVLINSTKHTLQYLTDGNLSIGGKLANFERIRVLETSQLRITGDTTIYNNIFAVMYWQQKEIVGVEIENPELVAMQKSIFENLWTLAKPLKIK